MIFDWPDSSYFMNRKLIFTPDGKLASGEDCCCKGICCERAEPVQLFMTIEDFILTDPACHANCDNGDYEFTVAAEDIEPPDWGDFTFPCGTAIPGNPNIQLGQSFFCEGGTWKLSNLILNQMALMVCAAPGVPAVVYCNIELVGAGAYIMGVPESCSPFYLEKTVNIRTSRGSLLPPVPFCEAFGSMKIIIHE